MIYVYLADLVVTIHVAYVAVVVFGLLLVLVGKAMGWKWVSNRWFRAIHLGMIVGVIVRTFFCDQCPLTDWESALRTTSGMEDPFTSVGWVLHYTIHPSGVPLWVFPPVYAVFGLLVILTLWFVPVRWRTEPRQATA